MQGFTRSAQQGGLGAIYIVGVDQMAHEEVAAAAAARHELGADYDEAVAEGLVERIGEEIDKRVDARLYGYPGPQAGPPLRRRPRREPVPGRVGFGGVVLALGSMGMAIGATAAVLHPGGDGNNSVSGIQFVLVALIWIIIGAVNIANAPRG